MCRSAEGNADHARLFSLYLSTKRQYKQAVDHVKRAATRNCIDSSANPCKAAWSIINRIRNKTTAYKCPASPDELNYYTLFKLLILLLRICLIGQTKLQARL